MKDESSLMAIRALLGALLLASMLCPTGRAAAAQPLLGAHNTITAVEDGTVDVVLPRDVNLPLKAETRAERGPAPWISFKGGGRAAGIVLIPRGSSAPLSYGLIANQFRSCRRGCPQRPVNSLMINGASYHGSETLRSGDYRLYVFTEDDITISLDLPELTGDTNIHIGRSDFADIRTPAVRVDQRGEVTAYSASASYEMKDDTGLFMSVNVMRDDNYKDAHFDECLAPDHVVPDEVEQTYFFPTGSVIVFVRPLDPTKTQPKKGGFILTTFVGLYDWPDELLNGDSSLYHYSFRVISPGSIAELWSQGVLLSF